MCELSKNFAVKITFLAVYLAKKNLLKRDQLVANLMGFLPILFEPLFMWIILNQICD